MLFSAYANVDNYRGRHIHFSAIDVKLDFADGFVCHS